MSSKKSDKKTPKDEEAIAKERPAELMWVEKYRPLHLKEIFDQVQIVSRLEALAKRPSEMPHLLFAGPPGTGKTTTAICLAFEIMGESWKDYTLELNASNERGIDTVRERIKNFASYSDRREGIPFRIVLLDESDAMCLDPRTKVITGRLDGDLSSLSLQELYQGYGDSTFDVPSFSSDSMRAENDRGRIIPSGRAELFEITFGDGRTIGASAEHPFFRLKDCELEIVKTKEIIPGKTEIIDCSSMFTHCFSCEELFYRNQDVVDQSKHVCSRCSYAERDEYVSQKRPAAREVETILISMDGKSIIRPEQDFESSAVIGNGTSRYDYEIPPGSIDLKLVRSVKKVDGGPARVLNISMKKNKNFFLANGILTHNTSDAQTALRRIMEESSRTTRFILTANYSSNIIEPIQSRCAIFRFSRLPGAEVIRYLEDVCKKERVRYEREGLEKIYEATEGDMRHALNMLQAASTLGDVSSVSVDKVTGLSGRSKVGEILDLAFEGEFLEARNKTIELLQVSGMSEHDFIKFANEALTKSDYSSSIEAIQATAETDFRLLQGSNPDIQISAYLATLSRIGEETRDSKAKKKE